MPALSSRGSMQEFWHENFKVQPVWVAEDGERVVGFCARGDDNIIGLYVTSDARGAGIGKRLLDSAKADRDWITAWVDAPNMRAVAFYVREGLVEISRETEEWSGLLIVEHRWKRPA
nr:GNAT family N-acetyltransferase [Jannaschia pohangensis]